MQHLIISTHFFFVLQLFCPHSVHFPACIIPFSETEKGRKSLVPQFPRTRFSNMNSETADKQLNDRLVPKQFLRRNEILLDLLEGKTSPSLPYSSMAIAHKLGLLVDGLAAEGESCCSSNSQ